MIGSDRYADFGLGGEAFLVTFRRVLDACARVVPDEWACDVFERPVFVVLSLRVSRRSAPMYIV